MVRRVVDLAGAPGTIPGMKIVPWRAWRGGCSETVARPAIAVVGAANEEAALDKDVEHAGAGGMVESPQPLRLIARELKTWHLQVLACDAAEQRFERITRHGVTRSCPVTAGERLARLWKTFVHRR